MKINGKGLPFRAHRDMIVRMSKQFQDHKKGVPEWLKNANDSYFRCEQKGKNCAEFPIILNFSKKEVYCLDFGGADGEVIKEYGIGPAAVRSIAGTTTLHKKLESDLASFKKVEAVVTFQGGFLANLATIPALVGEGDLIFSDELNHASIIDGLASSAVTVMGEGNEQTPLALIKDVPFITFQDCPPTKEEIEALTIKPEDDIYAPLLTSVKWKSG